MAKYPDEPEKPYENGSGNGEAPLPFSSVPGMDPRAGWLFGAGSNDFLIDGDDTQIPFSITLFDEEAVAAFREFVGSAREREIAFRLNVTHIDALSPKQTITGFAQVSFFEAMRARDQAGERFRDGRNIRIGISLPMRLDAGALPPPDFISPEDPVIELPDSGAWPDGTVVMAIIDDGIAFAHERFRNALEKSRVQCFWRQDGPFDTVHSTVPYGREICKHPDGATPPRPGIDGVLDASRVGGRIDEDIFYKETKVIDYTLGGHKPSAWRKAHGTHVLDLMAGEDPVSAAGNDDSRPIIAVQLPVAITADPVGPDRAPSGTALDDYAIAAVDYILERVDAMSALAGRSLPVVINFSYGLYAGSHDGTQELERILDDRIAARAGQLRVVLPAGNSHLSRTHAVISSDDLAAPQPPLVFRRQPDDRTPSFVLIWMPCGDDGAGGPPPSRVSVTVTAPDETTAVTLDETATAPEPIVTDSHEYGTLQYAFDAASQRGVFILSLHPTFRHEPGAFRSDPTRGSKIQTAPHGEWTITFENQALAAGEQIHAWIERDVRLHGYPLRGRQAYFDDDRYQRFDIQGRSIEEDGHPHQAATPSPVKRAGNLNSIATGDEVIVAGGFVVQDNEIADYSAGGPLPERCDASPLPPFTDPPRKPDAVLASDRSKVLEGVLAAATRSNARVAINGTSVAAPQLARWVANDIASGGTGDRSAVKVGATPMASPPPNDRSGWGTI